MRRQPSKNESLHIIILASKDAWCDENVKITATLRQEKIVPLANTCGLKQIR